MSRELASSSLNWQEFRSRMPVTKRWAYLDNAAVAAISQPAQEALVHYASQAALQGDTVWPEWSRRIEQIRELVAALLGAESQEVALIPNTTSGVNLVAEGFPWSAGDNVVTLAGEFPSNLYPWMNLSSRGVEERRVELDGIEVNLNRIAEACDRRTKIIALSWVGYASGWRIDVQQLAQLAHDHGALLFLDAIQGLGIFPLDVRLSGVDFLAADGHKWMLGPEGAGILFVKREHLDLLRPLGVGWNSVRHHHDFSKIDLSLRQEAARYEGGSQNMPGFFALGASLELLSRYGLSCQGSPLAVRVLEIARFAMTRLEEIGAQVLSSQEDRHRSGIVSFEMPGRDSMTLRQKCLEAGVVLSCRAGRLRISPHAYANEEDIDRFISVLGKSP